MVPTAPTPDALMIPEVLKVGRTQWHRIDSVCRIAEPILEVDRSKGEYAWIIANGQIAGQRTLFITKEKNASLSFPRESPLRGRPRYAWIDQPGGIRRGYLTPEAREELDKKKEKP